ncbi:MAG TPA: hypothetical protein VIO58_05955 [Candidatus Methanoperedens sp.]
MTANETPDELKRIIDVEEEKDKRIIDFVNKRQKPAVAIIASYSPRRISPTRRVFAELGISEEFGVESLLSMIPTNCKSVLLLLNSMGGAVQSSYMASKAIRDRFEEINVYVPHSALSGGTLLALTGNKIFMGTMSKLSPLDVQTDYKNTIVSTNALLRSKAKLDGYFATVDEEDAPYSMRVMADKLDPIIMEDWAGIQETMREYVEEILKMSGYKNVKRVANKLINELPSHSYVINHERAKKYGLKVALSTEDAEGWEVMRYWLAKYVTKATEKHFIRYACPKAERQKDESKEKK